ncbi:hypothetical protein [Thermomonas sp.]|uniref:hypothetical protein n=1 Tax=Thermomonas sp. TaxID=1971895 RepID=UPI0035AFBE6F
MNIVARTATAALIASSAPALPFLAIFLLTGGEPGSLKIALIILAICAAHVFALGVPTFLILQRRQLANRWSLMLAGLALGSIPSALASLPSALRGGSFNFSFTLAFGLFGVFSAWVFWFAWSRLGPNKSFKPTPLRGAA